MIKGLNAEPFFGFPTNVALILSPRNTRFILFKTKFEGKEEPSWQVGAELIPCDS
jgi:hypothetical protein